MEFYNQLCKETYKDKLKLYDSPIIKNCLNNNVSLESYVAFLTEAFHHVKHTVPLLMYCGSKLPADKEWLREKMAHYIDEEIGHQEWILNDLHNCGQNKEKIRNSQPKFETDLMVSFAYDMIERKNPVGLLGMIFVLEGTSIELATKTAKIINRELQLPKQAFSYLLSHGDLDICHIEFFKSILSKISCKNEQEFIINSAKCFFWLYTNIFNSLPMPTSTPKLNQLEAL